MNPFRPQLRPRPQPPRPGTGVTLPWRGSALIGVLLAAVAGCTSSAPPTPQSGAPAPDQHSVPAPEQRHAPAPVGTAADAPDGSDAPVTLVQSPNDHRDYRYLTLDNDLRVLLVSDPTADKAAASLTVFRGSYDETEAWPGLAHFLEHMLFIGTAKYPEVDAYQQFISRNGGSSNAYTAGDHTNYFFDVHPEQFPAAMDRFAQFFISPLFDPEYVAREKNAVNSEYQLQIKADNWRGSAVVNQVINPAHPQSRFSIGSLETLGEGVREALVEFFESAYSADQMVLVALSNQPLDEMAAWVGPMFEQIENRRIGPAPARPPLFTEGELPAVLNYRTIKDGYRVVYNFPIPPEAPYYRQKPAEYVSNLIGHEGEGSLHQRLQQAGWIESLAVGTGSFDRGNSLLVVDIALTDTGYANVDKVTDALFDYVALLQRNAPEAWRYQEQARVAELGFRFQEPSSATAFVYQVAPRFMDYPPQDVLAAPYLMEEFDADLIGRYIAALTPDNVLVEIAGPDVPTDARERWFDVPYALERRAPARTPSGLSGLALPEPNRYLPGSLAVLPDDPTPPQLALARPGLTLWSDRDTEFGTPRANLYLSLGVPDGFATPADLARATLYSRVVQDSLTATVYPAYLAGLGYGLDADGYGFELRVSGYDDKQLELVEVVLDRLVRCEVEPARFAALRDELLRDWRNYRDERPSTQAYGALGYLLLSSRWPPETLIEALGDSDAADLVDWCRAHTGTFNVLALDHGNIAADAPWALAATLRERLSLGAFPRYQPAVTEIRGASLYPLDIDHEDAAMVLYLQDPDDRVETRARGALASSVLRQAYFTSLRTEQQLGYVVAVANQSVRDRGGLAFMVQSPVASPAELVQRTREFLESELDVVRAMPEDEFLSYRQGLVGRLQERDRNLAGRGARLWQELDLGHTGFDSREQLAAAVADLTRDDLLAYLGDAVARFDAHRLLVYSNGRFADEAAAGPLQGTRLDSVSAFKAEAGSAL